MTRPRRYGLVLALAVAAVLAVGLVLLVVRELPRGLDPAAVEREVAAEYEERTGVAVEVRCPEEMPENSGEVQPCEGARPDGEVVYIEIQIADPGEDVDYHWWTPPT